MSILSSIHSEINNSLNKILELRNQKVLKNDDSFVSQGDLLTEKIVTDYLKKEYPSYGIISEESPELFRESLSKENIIVIDPIDGTENFVSGLKEWGVALCFYHKGKHVESLLYLPELNMTLKTGDKIKRFESRIAGLSSSLTKEDLVKLESGYEYRIIGCCVYNMYNVVTGRYATFENPKGAYVWDILPGLNLALEHGLEVIVNNQKYHGELLNPTQKYTFKIR